MKTFAISLIAILVGVFTFNYFTSYRSAFEADQQCHYEMQKAKNEGLILNCDHDLETNQWILFEQGLNNNPAKIVRRFRY